MPRTCSTSPIQREVIQAKGHTGSNQKSALLTLFWGAVTSETSCSDTGNSSEEWKRGIHGGPLQDRSFLGQRHLRRTYSVASPPHHGQSWSVGPSWPQHPQ